MRLDGAFQSLPSEIEVKYKIAECYTILKLDKDAIAVLEGIPSRQRTPKVQSLKYEPFFFKNKACKRILTSLRVQINMMLANLYKKAGQERSAVTSYKEVLRQCPLALDAIIGNDLAHIRFTKLTHTLKRPARNRAIWSFPFRSSLTLSQRS